MAVSRSVAVVLCAVAHANAQLISKWYSENGGGQDEVGSYDFPTGQFDWTQDASSQYHAARHNKRLCSPITGGAIQDWPFNMMQTTYVTLWFRPSNGPGKHPLITWGIPGSFNSLSLVYESKKVGVMVGRYFKETQDVAADKWHYLEFYYAHSQGVASLIVNGAVLSYQWDAALLKPGPFDRLFIGCIDTKKDKVMLRDVRYHNGPHPCGNVGTPHYNGLCYYTSDQPHSVKINGTNDGCQDGTPQREGKLISISDLWQDWYVSLLVAQRFAEPLHVGYVATQERDRLSARDIHLWKWLSSPTVLRRELWCGDKAHVDKAGGVDQWKDMKTCGSGDQQQPNTVSSNCGVYDPSTGVGLLDRSCADSNKYLCSYSAGGAPSPVVSTPAPPTPSPSTPAPPTPVPPTPAPQTPAPPTPAPMTPAPPTPAPPTPAPPTPSPPTTAPPTPAPPTPAPQTPAPPTPSPPTPAPATQAPPTPAPPTPAPRTPAPATPSPPTPAPPTPAPLTQAPATPAPLTPAPPTSAPPTPAPATPAPPTPAPQTPAPPTPAPSTPAPATPAPATGAPPTQAPATQAPLTSAPATPAPPTPAPPTPVPLTAAPPTPAPATAAPATGTPPTQAPATRPPATAAPPTPSPPLATPAPTPPPTRTPETDLPSTEAPLPPPATGAPTTEPSPLDLVGTPAPAPKVISGSVSSVTRSKASSASAAATASVSTSGGMVKALMDIECKVEDVDLDNVEPLDWEFHPLQFPLGSHGNKYFLGAAVSNVGIILVFLGVNYLIALAQVTCLDISWGDALFYVRAPGLVYLPILWLLMGTSMAASNMAFFPSRAPASVAVVGWVALLTCMALPAVMWHFLLRPSRFSALTMPDPRIDVAAAAVLDSRIGGDKHVRRVLQGWKRRMYILVFGEEVWVRRDGAHDHYVAQWGLFFEMYRGRYHWFSVVEMGQMLFLALCSAWKPSTFAMCATRNILITVVLFAFFLAVVILQPYNSTFDHIVAVLMSGLMFLAVLLMSAAILSQTSPGDATVQFVTDTAGVLLMASALLLAAKGVYDIALYIFDLKIGRRRTAMNAATRGCIEEVMCEAPLDLASLGNAEAGDVCSTDGCGNDYSLLGDSSVATLVSRRGSYPPCLQSRELLKEPSHGAPWGSPLPIPLSCSTQLLPPRAAMRRALESSPASSTASSPREAKGDQKAIGTTAVQSVLSRSGKRICYI